MINNEQGCINVTANSIDADIANELISSFDDHYEAIQVGLNKLGRSGDDSALINDVFRSIHTIKGNAAMAQLPELVDFTHAIEETAAALRSGELPISFTLCDLILTGIDRLRDLHNTYLFGKENQVKYETEIASEFSSLATARTPENIDKHFKNLERLFSPPSIDSTETTHAANNSNALIKNLTPDEVSLHEKYLSLSEQEIADLTLFRTLALQIDEQNNYWNKRTDKLLYLGLKMLSLSNSNISATQLIAAIYVHDLGMAFVPDMIVNKATKLNPLETKRLQQHPIWSYELLNRMNGWDEAALMVLDHHERIDGQGYPNEKMGEKLAEGAKLIAIADAFYAMTHLRADRSHRRSMMRAISEINACIDSQFSSKWVAIFNDVIRQQVKIGYF